MAPDDRLLGAYFFPIEVGMNLSYEVEEINYRNNGEVDTSRFYVIDSITEKQTEGNQDRYYGYRLRKESLVGASTVLYAIQYLVSDQTIVQQIGNQKSVVFSLPVQEGKSWNANGSASPADEFQYFKVFQTYDRGDTVFQETVQVLEEENYDSLELLDVRIKVYAAQTGLIESLISQLEFCVENDCFGLQEIEFGTTTSMKRVF